MFSNSTTSGGKENLMPVQLICPQSIADRNKSLFRSPSCKRQLRRRIAKLNTDILLTCKYVSASKERVERLQHCMDDTIHSQLRPSRSTFHLQKCKGLRRFVAVIAFVENVGFMWRLFLWKCWPHVVLQKKLQKICVHNRDMLFDTLSLKS